MKELLSETVQEIEELRRHNQLMQAQLAIVDVFAAALGLKPSNPPMKPDVVYRLRQQIERMSNGQ